MTDPQRCVQGEGGLGREGARLTQVLESDYLPAVFVHSSLRRHLHPGSSLWGNPLSSSFTIEYVEYDELSGQARNDDVPVMLPVNTEYQAEILASVRAQYAMALIVAVTNDMTGYGTYFAIRSGANLVLNVAIPGRQQAEILHAHLREHCRPPAADRQWPAEDPVTYRKSGGSGLTAVGNAAVGHECAQENVHASPGARPGSDMRLLQMLRSGKTVAEIARESYISERSMYRRIRRLYDKLGVDSRAELMILSGQNEQWSKLSDPA